MDQGFPSKPDEPAHIKPAKPASPEREADWLAWSMQFVFGHVVGWLLSGTFIEGRRRSIPLISQENAPVFSAGVGLIVEALASRYGDQMWLGSSYRMIPPDAPQQSQLRLSPVVSPMDDGRDLSDAPQFPEEEKRAVADGCRDRLARYRTWYRSPHLMKRTNQCPKCGSTDIIADAKILAPRAGEVALTIFRDPDALLFKGQLETHVSAWVCSDCGFVEFYAQKRSK